MFFKNFVLCFYVTAFCINFSFSIPTDNLKLELIQVLFRHGARAPIECEAKLLSKISNETSYAPWGYSQLTSQGMMQEYQIGQMLRERYNDFIPSSYDIDHVYAYASGVRRTKASLELVLAALYPPTGKLAWNPKLDWMPIAINSNPRPMDILIKSRDCPKYKEVIQKLMNSSEIKTELAKHEEIHKKMEEIYGESFDFDRIFCAYNAIVVHKNMNLPLPDWYNEDIFIKLNEAIEFYLETLSYTQTLKRLNGGTLVRKFTENLKNSNKRKLYLYSAHDKTLHAFLRAHNITDTKSPDYGSSVILEKLRDKNDKIYVKLLLWTGEPKKLITLSLKNCEEVCPLNKYLEIVNSVLPSDDEMLCLFKDLQPKDIEKILATDTTNIED